MKKNTANVPKLRFPGFTDDWEQRKLGEIATFAKGSGFSKNDLRDEGTPIILYGRLYTKYQAIISEVDTYAEPRGNVLYSTGNEVIIPASGETADDIAIASAVVAPGIMLGGDLNIVYPTDNIDATFVAISISNGEPQKELAKKAQGKSVVHLHNSDLKEVTLAYPRNDEQKKISCYFTKIDHLITLHQRKLAHLQAKKKGLLQKMFPQQGECFPELRFPGFTDAWEQCKLSELGEVITGSTPSTQVQAYYSDDGIPWVTPTDILNNVTYRTAKHLSEEGQKIARVVPQNTVLVTCIASIGKNTMLGTTGSFNQQINGLVPNEKENHPYFLFAESTLWSEKMKRSAPAGTMQIVNKTEFSEFKTNVPNLAEQTRIGAFFNHLDKLITLHQRKLTHLQKQKKGQL